MRTISATPGPYTVCHILSFSLSFNIKRMLCQQLLRFKYKFIKQFRRFRCAHAPFLTTVFPTLFRFYQQTFPLLFRMIMGWGTLYMLASPFYYQQMPVLCSCYKTYLLISKTIVKIMYQYVAFFRFQMSTVMIDDLTVGKSDDITSQCQVLFLHFIPYGNSLERSAPFINLVKVISQDSGICHFRPGMKVVRNGYKLPCSSLTCQCIHVRSFNMLQQSLSTKPSDMVICHTVS